MRGGLKLGIAAGVLTATLALVVLPALAKKAKTELVSRSSSGEPADEGSERASISRTGRFVVFASEADNLPGGISVNDRIYVRDRKMDRTRLLSKTSAGEPVDTSFVSPLGGAISASGRFVVFSTNSSLLPGNHTGFPSNVYLHDRARGKTRLISKTSAGDPAMGGDSNFPTISASGRFVAFTSEATNLPGDHTYANVYVHDRETGRTILASKTSAGDPATGGQSVGALMSPSGRYVGFESNATNLGGDNSYTDVFVHDRKTKRTRLISRNSAGDPATGNDSYGGWISASGRYVGFESGATNLPGLHSDLQFNAYVRDLKTGKTRLISKTTGGEPAAGGQSFRASISASGRYVAFISDAINLPGPGDDRNAYVHDRRTGKTTLVTRTSAGEGAGGDELQMPAISATGRFVAFESDATSLPGSGTQVYVRGPLR